MVVLAYFPLGSTSNTPSSLCPNFFFLKKLFPLFLFNLSFLVFFFFFVFPVRAFFFCLHRLLLFCEPFGSTFTNLGIPTRREQKETKTLKTSNFNLPEASRYQNTDGRELLQRKFALSDSFPAQHRIRFFSSSFLSFLAHQHLGEQIVSLRLQSETNFSHGNRFVPCGQHSKRIK